MHVVAVPSDGLRAEIVLHLPREVSNRTAPELRRRFDDALAAESGSFTLDCTAVTFIDAAGLGALVHLANGARSEQRSVRLVNVNPWVRRIIGLGGLGPLLLTDDASDLVSTGRLASA